MEMVRWTKEQHEKAKAEGLDLVCLAAYGKYAKRGSFTFYGPVTRSQRKILDDALIAISKSIQRRSKRENN